MDGTYSCLPLPLSLSLSLSLSPFSSFIVHLQTLYWPTRTLSTLLHSTQTDHHVQFSFLILETSREGFLIQNREPFPTCDQS